MIASSETNLMAVSHEIKSQLAKLLATEDLVVEHKKVQTACFNVHTRVLTLPMWEKASNTVYDLLVGHEVGHALYTPDEDWLKEHKIPPQFVNVVEDARIEKLMKRRYAGLSKTFFNGYKELADQDFFQIEDEDISSFNLADRANLWFKIGNYTNVPIERGEETEIINLIADTETFADVLIAAEELYKYCKQKQQEETKTSLDNLETQQSGANNQPASDFSDQQEGENDQSESDGKEGSASNETTPEMGDTTPEMSGEKNKEPEVKTMESLEEALKELINNSGSENVYVEVPKVNLDTVVGKNSEVHKDIDACFAQQQKSRDEQCIERGWDTINLFKHADEEFKKFKLSAQKEVNYLVKEFECRKAADAYSRSATARTGVLDTTRLHTYKYNEDLFKKVTVLPDGKNHGLVFVLDWSGSMQRVLLDTCKQLFNLVWFCKKVAIPFEVYAFTNEWRRGEYDYSSGTFKAADRTWHYEKKEGLLQVDETFSMMNLLTSKVSGKELEHQMMNIWRLAICFSDTYHTPYTYPTRLCLSGTPLNEALISLHQILPKFQKENKLQKVQCIVLTDGEASQIPYHVEVQRHWESQPYIGVRGINPEKTFLRDRKLGTTYKIEYGYHHFTDMLLKNLKDKFSTTNFIGIRVIEGRNASRFMQLYYDSKENEKMQSDWKKLKSFTIKNSGYDAYFGLSASALSQDAEFDVAEDASKAQIKSAFAKSLKTKKLNKKVLGEFISLVA